MGKEWFEVLVEDADCLTEGRGHGPSRQERGPTWFEEPLMELGEQVGQAQAEGSDEIAVCASDAKNEAPAAQPSQVVRHLVGSVGVGKERLDETAQIPMAKTMNLKPIVAERCQQGHRAGIAEAQGCDAMTVGEQGSVETCELFAVALTGIGEALGGEQTPVGALADCLELPEVGQGLADPEVGRFVDGRFGAQGVSLFEVLLDVAVLVLDVEAGIDAVGDDAGPVPVCGGRGTTGQPAVKQQADAVGTPQVEISPHDLVKKVASVQRAVEDLGEAQLELPEAELVSVPSLSVLAAERPGKPLRPALEESLDRLRTELVAHLLEPSRVLTGEKTVVEALEADPFSAQLLLDPLVAVEAELPRVGQIGADLDECRPPVRILEVEVELVDEEP